MAAHNRADHLDIPLVMTLEFCGTGPRQRLSAHGGGKGRVNTRSDVRTAPRLHSSDHGRFSHIAASAAWRTRAPFGDFCALDIRAQDRRRAINIPCRSIQKGPIADLPTMQRINDKENDLGYKTADLSDIHDGVGCALGSNTIRTCDVCLRRANAHALIPEQRI
jgi:hypothetical protein